MKTDIIRIETPEKITFSYHIASIGTRIAAYFIDILIQGAVLVLLGLFFLSLAGFSFDTNWDFTEDAGFLTLAFYYLVIFFLQWGYFILFEVITNGQSPGKKAMRIRVMRSSGEALDFATIVIRNLLRAVDGFPLNNLLGGVIAIIDRKSRRLGDIISDTIVVNEIIFNLQEPVFHTNLSNNEFHSGRILQPAGKRLSENELYILRRFLNEREKIPADKQIAVAGNLTSQIIEKLNLKQDREKIPDPLLFIEQVYKEHTNENDQ